MSGRITIDPEACASAARRAGALSTRLEECRTEMLSINTDLRAAGFQGRTADSCNTFVTEVGAPALYNCSEMLCQTEQAIIHTCDQFASADQTLSRTFSG